MVWRQSIESLATYSLHLSNGTISIFAVRSYVGLRRISPRLTRRCDCFAPRPRFGIGGSLEIVVSTRDDTSERGIRRMVNVCDRRFGVASGALSLPFSVLCSISILTLSRTFGIAASHESASDRLDPFES